MTKSAFDKIAAGLEDAIAFAGDEKSRARIAEPMDVRAIRKAAGKTQEQFSTTFHIPIGTVRDWEQARRQPDAPARALLALIAKDPQWVAQRLAD